MGTKKARYPIANIHAQILRAYMDTGDCLYLPIHDTETLKEMICPVDCDDETLDFLAQNHICLNESSDWGWTNNFPLYARNSIILRDFLNEINCIPLYSYVHNLFFYNYKSKIENMILNAYTSFLCTPLDNHLDEANTMSYISHSLIRDYKEKLKLKNAIAGGGTELTFKAFICNDCKALQWWKDNKSQLKNHNYIIWEDADQKPTELFWYRRDCLESTKARVFLADKDLLDTLGEKQLHQTDYIFGLGDMAGSIVESLSKEIMEIESIFYKEFFETGENQYGK